MRVPKVAASPAQRSPSRRCGGFLLLEVLLAVVLLAIGLSVLIDGLGRSLAAARSVQYSTTAVHLLANKSFEFRVEKPNEDGYLEGTFDEVPQFSWSRSLEPTDHDYLWAQRITVFWYERGQVARESIVEYRYLPGKEQ